MIGCLISGHNILTFSEVGSQKSLYSRKTLQKRWVLEVKSTASVDKREETLRKQMENITLSGNYRLLAEIPLQAYLVGRNFEALQSPTQCYSCHYPQNIHPRKLKVLEHWLLLKNSVIRVKYNMPTGIFFLLILWAKSKKNDWRTKIS